MQRCSERASERQRERARERERAEETGKRERERERERRVKEHSCHQRYLRESIHSISISNADVLIHKYSYLRDNTIRHDILRVSGSKLGIKEASNV